MWDDINVNDAQMRLAGCVVRYSNTPVYISRVFESGGDVFCEFNKLGEMDEGHRRRKVNDENWNFKPVRLGYVNLRGETFFVERAPVRKWKQGLHPDNIHIVPDFRDGRKGILTTMALRSCINGDYPSIETAVDRINNKWISHAFHRFYALSVTKTRWLYNLGYRGVHVGTYNHGLGLAGFKLDQSYQFLNEELQEVLHAKAG